MAVAARPHARARSRTNLTENYLARIATRQFQHQPPLPAGGSHTPECPMHRFLYCTHGNCKAASGGTIATTFSLSLLSMKVYYTILQPSGRSLRPLQKCTSTHHTPSTASDAQVVDGALLRHYANYYVEYSTSMARRKGETFTYRALPFLDCCPHEEKGRDEKRRGVGEERIRHGGSSNSIISVSGRCGRRRSRSRSRSRSKSRRRGRLSGGCGKSRSRLSAYAAGGRS